MNTHPNRPVRPSYRRALQWIADNDDNNNWLRTMTDEEMIPSVTACLVADLFGKTEEAMIRDLRKVLERVNDDGIA